MLLSRSLAPLSAVLTVMFDPADYEVSEGETVQLILVTNNPYSFSFTINVTTQDGSAICKFQLCSLGTSIAKMSQPLFALCPSCCSCMQHLLTIWEVVL